MVLSMFQASVPCFVHALNTLSTILAKAEDFSKDRSIDPSILIGARLAPDMYPLSRQVQIVCDVIKGGVARLAGVELPSFPDTETSFSELQERIVKTRHFIESFAPEAIDGSETRAVSLKAGSRELTFEGQAYLLRFVIPNVYFHITTVYAILRHNGVALGKIDFLGKIQ